MFFYYVKLAKYQQKLSYINLYIQVFTFKYGIHNKTYMSADV